MSEKKQKDTKTTKNKTTTPKVKPKEDDFKDVGGSIFVKVN